jgi:hypothetical protein
MAKSRPATPDDALLPGIICIIVGIILVFFGFKWFKRKKLIEDIPTSKIRSLAMGLSEINGRVIKGAEILKGPLTQKDCVYYKYTVEEYRGGKHSHWVTIESAEKGVHFFLQDETGAVLVDPQKAEIEVPMDLMTYNKPDFFHLSVNILPGVGFSIGEPRRRYTEWNIEPNDILYILGTAGDNPFIEEGTADKSVMDVMIQKGDSDYYISNTSEKSLLLLLTLKSLAGIFGGCAMMLGGLALILIYLKVF